MNDRQPTIARTDAATKSKFYPRRSFFWEARTRILAWYALLMTSCMGISIPIFSQLVISEVDSRVQADLVEDIEAFKQYIEERPAIGEKLDKDKLDDLFQNFMFRKVPEDDTYLIAFLDGEFERSSPRARPKQLDRDSELMKRWARLTQRQEGEWETSDPDVGKIIYMVEPVISEGKVLGVFVTAHTSAGERREATTAIFIAIQVLLVVLVLGLVLAWLASGRILAPLRSLLQTARAIGESDLSQRLPVRGVGEIADLANTFNEMMDRLEQAFASQRAFVNDASHELRTPITIIRGHLELMGDDPQEQQETIALVLDELDRMNRFVNDLLLLARLERPDFLQLETIDLDSFTEEIYTKATALARRDWQLEAKGRGRIAVDRQRITQAITNLAQNATQHTAETDTIAVGSAVDSHNIRFWVRDTGAGILQTDQKRIFERFARANKSRRRSEGAGLGLAIVRAIAEAHGGKIELASELGTGSTFVLVLPLELPHQRMTA
jgi:signal transduction histidine kinase